MYRDTISCITILLVTYMLCHAMIVVARENRIAEEKRAERWEMLLKR